MLVTLHETELLSLEMTTDRIGALPSPLFQQYGDLASILKDRVVESAGVWSS